MTGLEGMVVAALATSVFTVLLSFHAHWKASILEIEVKFLKDARDDHERRLKATAELGGILLDMNKTLTHAVAGKRLPQATEDK